MKLRCNRIFLISTATWHMQTGYDSCICFRMSAQDTWLRKYHELWEKLEDNTKSSFCTALWKWLVLKTGHAMHTCTLKLAHASTRMVEGFLSSYACMQAWCERKGFDTVIHPIPKRVIFLEDLLQEMVDKKSKDPFGTIKVARKALSKIR